MHPCILLKRVQFVYIKYCINKYINLHVHVRLVVSCNICYNLHMQLHVHVSNKVCYKFYTLLHESSKVCYN